MRICVVPGSFDPVTVGHTDVIRRAARLYDKVVVAVTLNRQKTGFLPVERRIELIRTCFPSDDVEVRAFTGLLTGFAREVGACALVKGLRGVADFEYERQMEALNHGMAPQIETVFLFSRAEHAHISSSMVREIGMLGGDIRAMVPEPAADQIIEAFQSTGGGKLTQ